MTKTNKLTVILTAIFVIAIIATATEIISCIKEARIPDWLLISAMFSAFTVAFSSLTKNKVAEAK